MYVFLDKYRMDDAVIYQHALDLISSHLPYSSHMESERRLSAVLSNAGMVVAYLVISWSLLWLTTKSVLLRRTPLIYYFAAFIFLCGVSHLGHIISYPLYFQYGVDFVSAVVSLMTAVLTYRQRHMILSTVYQFKYAVGLMRNLERIDDVDRPAS